MNGQVVEKVWRWWTNSGYLADIDVRGSEVRPARKLCPVFYVYGYETDTQWEVWSRTELSTYGPMTDSLACYVCGPTDVHMLYSVIC